MIELRQLKYKLKYDYYRLLGAFRYLLYQFGLRKTWALAATIDCVTTLLCFNQRLGRANNFII